MLSNLLQIHQEGLVLALLKSEFLCTSEARAFMHFIAQAHISFSRDERTIFTKDCSFFMENCSFSMEDRALFVGFSSKNIGRCASPNQALPPEGMVTNQNVVLILQNSCTCRTLVFQNNIPFIKNDELPTPTYPETRNS